MTRLSENLKAVLLLIAMVVFTIPALATTYEDAEDNATTGWVIYTGTTDATVMNVADSDKGSRVIELMGNGQNTGYRLGNQHGKGSDNWNNQTEKQLQWSMKYDEDFTILVSLLTVNGNRFLSYTNQSEDIKGVIRGGKVRYGLGENSIDGTWHTFSRDLEADWNAYMPNNPIVAVNGFFIRGSGRVDDIMLSDNAMASLTANAGADQDVNVTASNPSVTLDGSGSIAGANGPIVNYEWFYNGESLGRGMIIDVEPKLSGDYTVTLVVTDSVGDTASDTVDVNVSVISNPTHMHADAGPDINVTLTPDNPTVTLDGSASTPGTIGNIVKYEWFYNGDSLGTGVTLDVVPPASGFYTATLVITDNFGNTDSDTINGEILIVE